MVVRKIEMNSAFAKHQSRGLLLLQSLANEFGAVFNEITIFRSKCRRKMTVNIEFTSDFAIHKYGDYDL
jgi:hypothetical protein